MPGDSTDGKEAVDIVVPAEDPVKDPKKVEQQRLIAEQQKETDLANKGKDAAAKRRKEKELSAEDAALKEKLEGLVLQLQEGKSTFADDATKAVLGELAQEIRTSTSSMTSIPKPLKFLRPHFDALKDLFTDLPEDKNRTSNLAAFSDILSVLSMTFAADGSLDSLKYCLSGSVTQITSWGHEYVRSLCGELGLEWSNRLDNASNNETDVTKTTTEDLLELVELIIPFKIEHKSEMEAVDLLIEVDLLHKITDLFTDDNYKRVCQYVDAVALFCGDLEDSNKLQQVVLDQYQVRGDWANATREAIKLGDKEKLVSIFAILEEKDNEAMRSQCAYILGEHKMILEELEDDDELYETMGNATLASNFAQLVHELDVKKVKSPEDIYKTHLAEGRARHRDPTDGKADTKPTHDSAKANLASTFVNAFINCGFQTDSLLTTPKSEWVYHNRDVGMLSAAASHGLISLWEVELGFNDLDIYSRSVQSNIVAGGLLGSGILSCGITSEMDAAFTLLSAPLEDEENPPEKNVIIAAVLGLGLAYAGTNREDVLELLVPLIVDDSQPMIVASVTCLALGLVFTGTANEDISGSIIEAFLDRSETDLKDSSAKFMCLGMGLLFLGSGAKCAGVLQSVSVVSSVSVAKYLEMTIQACAYAGTGSVLEIQKLLAVCSEPFEEDSKNPDAGLYQQVATVGIAMIAMGEPLSSTMALRVLDHMLQYGNDNVKRGIPLALGLLSVSAPDIAVLDSLSRLSHHADEQVSQNAILALGLVSAGTNNSRVASTLRNLAVYYGKEPDHLFLVRLAQGLLHLGKGLMTLDPFHSDEALMNKTAVCGLLTVLHCMFDAKRTLLADKHYLLFSIVTAMRPRMLMTVDADGEFVPVEVRVGKKVDTVGQVGNPRTITGFQTHTTPVLLSKGDRAELQTEEYIALTPILEGVVIVKKNPDYVPAE